MSVPAASLNKVVDGVNRMASLRVVFSQVKIGVADGTDFDLDPASIAAIKTNLQTKYDAIAAQVKAEVAANW